MFRRVEADFGSHDWKLVLVGAIACSLGGLGALLINPNDLTTLEFIGAAGLVVVISFIGVTFGSVMLRRREQQGGGLYNRRLNAALNNMCQGLCMFDAAGRLQVWNDRYIEMSGLRSAKVRAGWTVSDLLAARVKAGTFPPDLEPYVDRLNASVREGKPFTTQIEQPDGRIVAVVNRPIEGGGWVATHEDITERVRAERELVRTRSFLDTIISNVPMPIVVKNLPDLRYMLVNKAAAEFFGRPDGEFFGKTAHEIAEKGWADAITAKDREVLRTGRKAVSDEHSITTHDGQSRVVTTTRVPIKNAAGTPEYLISVVQDVTQRKRDEARISYMVHHDPLTHLPNREAFSKCLAATCELANKENEQFAVLSIDLDRFQGINDVFGHSAGDALLRQVATRLEEACQGAFLARAGGDEFVVISPTGPQPASAEALAERLVEGVSREFEVDGRRVSIGITVGIGVYPEDGAEPDTLIANTDAALFRAKSQARGSIRFFEPAMDQRLRDRRALQHELRTALAGNELELYYQPVNAIAGNLIGFEALLRWNNPKRGMVPPSTFIPIAEEIGLIGALGEWVLRAACKEAATWPRHLHVMVNLSPLQFQTGDLSALVHTTLLETGMTAGRLDLEITEGVLVQDFSRAVSILRRLKALGVQIAMDDFGTGYSSLSYLQSFPFDKIKIDQSFIINVGRNEQSGAIVRAVIGLAHGLNLPVVAEGVETEEQRAFLRSAGCDEVQGYLIGQPARIETYAELLGLAAPEETPRRRRQSPAA
ncbi:MAG: EAL domain-containing protein [Pseudolabrys sp.]|nr:EAL domain-containing protein [Pseudolabrys sp.]